MTDDLPQDNSARKPLKAFAVTEEGEGTGGIIFAKSAIVARREGANEYADGDFGYVTCHRAPWADHCAEDGHVSAILMIQHGWHFECAGCGNRIDEYWMAERDIYPEDVSGSQHGAVYCTPLCEARHGLDRAEARHRETRWIRRFRKIIKRRFPTAKLIDAKEGFCAQHAYVSHNKGRWEVQQVSVGFGFDGMEFGPASLEYRRLSHKRSKPSWSCCGGDRDAFQAFAKACKVPA